MRHFKGTVAFVLFKKEGRKDILKDFKNKIWAIFNNFQAHCAHTKPNITSNLWYYNGNYRAQVRPGKKDAENYLTYQKEPTFALIFLLGYADDLSHLGMPSIAL